MVKHRFLSLVLCAALALVGAVSLAAQGALQGFPVTVLDDAGRELTFDAPPQRVVLLSYQPIADLAALGIVPIAVREYGDVLARDPRNYGELAETFTVLDTNTPDILETLAALQPDFIIGDLGGDLSALESIAPVYIEVAGAEPLETVEDYTRYVEDFGIIFNKQDEAQALITSVLDRVNAYAQLSPNNRTVSVVALADEGEAVWFPPDCGAVLKLVAICAHSSDRTDWFTTTSEGLLSFNPDVLIIEQWTPSEAEWAQNNIEGDPLWGELNAVTTDSVHMVPASDARPQNLVTQARTLDALMPLIYPEVFPAPLTDAQVAEILAGEGAASAAGEASVSFVDGAGNTITLPAVPERVICLYHACLEYLAVLGIEPIAVPEYPHVYQFAENPLYFAQPNGIERLAMPEGAPDLEQIAALQPDLVFGWAELRESLEGIAPLHDVGALGNDYRSTLEDLRSFAAIFGREDVAEAAIARFENRLAAYQALSPRDLTVLQSGGDGEYFWISTINSVPCSLFNEVAICAWDDPNPTPGVWGYGAGIEAVLDLNPDVLVFESWVPEMTSAELSAQLSESNLLWREISAVQAGRIFDDTGRDSYGIGPIGGTRLLDTYMPLLYPETFPAPLTDEQVAEILAGEAEASSEAAFPVTVVDATGRELTFDTQPERIVCLLTACTHDMSILGVLPIAVGPEGNLAAAKDPAVFGDAADAIGVLPWVDGYDFEALAALDPDLIVGWVGIDEYLPLEALAGIAPLYMAGDPMRAQDMDALSADLRNLAQLLGREDVAEQYIADLNERLRAYDITTEGQRASYVVVRLTEPNTGIIAVPPDCGAFMAQLATCAIVSEGWQELSIEGLLSFDPPIIITEDWGSGPGGTASPVAWANVTLWSELSAVQSERVYHLSPTNTLAYSTLSVARSLDTLMPLIYPEVFPAPLTDEQVAEILAEAS
jgi:iron complex transport system substrate-binding protein